MQVFTCPCDVPSPILSLIPGLEQNTCCGLLFLSASISSLSHRSSPPGSPLLLYTNPQSQQAFPGNLSGTMTREDCKKTAYFYVFFLSSKSNPLVSSSVMQHTTCCGLSSLSAQEKKQIMVEEPTFIPPVDLLSTLAQSIPILRCQSLILETFYLKPQWTYHQDPRKMFQEKTHSFYTLARTREGNRNQETKCHSTKTRPDINTLIAIVLNPDDQAQT